MAQMLIPRAVHVCRDLHGAPYTKNINKVPYHVGFTKEHFAYKVAPYLNEESVHVYLRPMCRTAEINSEFQKTMRTRRDFKKISIDVDGQFIALKKTDSQQYQPSKICFHKFLLECNNASQGIAIVHDIYRENPYNVIFKCQFIEPLEVDVEQIQQLGVFLSLQRTYSFLSELQKK